MAMVTYPLNNIEYTAEDAELFNSTRTSGIYATNSFDYSLSGTNNTIIIGTGIAWIKNSEFSGKVVAQKEPISLDMGIADSVYQRIDAVVIRFNANKNATEIVIKKGKAASNPSAPSVSRTESIYELHLYHVRRGAGESSISANNITDLRSNANYCGLMSDSVTQAVDGTLTIRGVAADAKATGDALNNKLSVSGGQMTGNIDFGNMSRGFRWALADGTRYTLFCNSDLNIFQIYRTDTTGNAATVFKADSDGNPSFGKPLPIDSGGTGATNAASALLNLIARGQKTTGTTAISNLTDPGTYWLDLSNCTGGPATSGFGWLEVCKYDTSLSTLQRFTFFNTGATYTNTYVNSAWQGWVTAETTMESVTYPGCYYRMVDEAVEWVNPPMLTGVEYKTTERYAGKTVYKMLIRHEGWTSGDNIEILFPDKKIYVISADAIAGSIPLPSIGPTMSASDSAWVAMYTEVGHLVIQQRGGKAVGGPLSVIIKYYYAS